jgi:selenophosphate synthetase-related protein
MAVDVDALATRVRGYTGLTRKAPIREVAELLAESLAFGPQLPGHGDDAAVIPWQDGFLLLAADGMMTRLLVNEPYAAGKAAIMVTVNDIFAMGGRPIGLVNVLASGPAEQRHQILAGIAKGCRKLMVPMLGGHLHPDAPADQPALSVAILGSAQRLLRSHLAAAGDDLVVAVDLDGRAGCHSVVSWDANSGKTPGQLRERLEILPQIAEAGLSQAAKDISNAGLIGTAAIMMENSGKGAIIDVDAIPRPEEIALEEWLLCFQSYGFVLSVPPANTVRVLEMFAARQITARAIGKVTLGCQVVLRSGDTTAVLFDFSRDQITGISAGKAQLEI